MIFAHTYERVLDGSKTQTRRKAVEGDLVISSQANGVEEVRRRGRLLYKPGRLYSVQPGRGKPAIGKVRLLSVRCEPVKSITEADAIAEGCKSHYCSPEDTASCKPGTKERELAEILEGGFFTARNDFWNLWDDIHGRGSYRRDIAYALTFELVGEAVPS